MEVKNDKLFNALLMLKFKKTLKIKGKLILCSNNLLINIFERKKNNPPFKNKFPFSTLIHAIVSNMNIFLRQMKTCYTDLFCNHISKNQFF